MDGELRHDTKEGFPSKYRRIFQGGGVGFPSKNGFVRKGLQACTFMYIYLLIKDCVKVINKPCVRDARYMRLISWTLWSGSEQ